MPDMFPSIDLDILVNVVRRAQKSNKFEIADWTVKILSQKGAITPHGIFRVSGTGWDDRGTRTWEVALKIIHKSKFDEGPRHRVYWKRELYAYESGLLSRLPGPVVPALCFHTSKQREEVWLWTELLECASGNFWTLSDFVFAADQLGRTNGLCVMDNFLPAVPWLAQSHVRDWNSKVVRFAETWQIPSIRSAFTSAERKRLQQLETDSQHFLAVLDLLPRVFSHYDFKRSNLFIRHRTKQQREIVAIDWADCGFGALGGDLAYLVGGSTFYFDWDVSRVSELSKAALLAYTQGVKAAGWKGDERNIMLAYMTWMALYYGLNMPAAMAWLRNPANHESAVRLFDQDLSAIPLVIRELGAFALDCADVARGLMDQLEMPLQ